MSWEAFKASAQEAAELARPGEFDYIGCHRELSLTRRSSSNSL